MDGDLQDTPETLARIERRLDRLEASLGRLTGLLDQAMPLLAMAGDIADEAAAEVSATGVPLDARAAQASALAVRLTEPSTAAALGRLLDRVEAIDSQVASMPGTVAMVLDIVDAELTKLSDEGRDVDAMFRQMADLATLLGDPRVGQLTAMVLARTDLIRGTMDVFARAPETTAMVLDMADDLIREAGEEGVDLGLLIPRLHDGTKAAVAFLTSDGFHAFMATMADPEAFGHLVPIIRSIRTSTATPPEPIGLLGLIRELRNPRVQYALGLFMRFANAIGTTHEQFHTGADPRRLEDK